MCGDTYRLDGSEEAFELLSANRSVELRRWRRRSRRRRATCWGFVGTLVSRGVDDIVAVPVRGERMGISVAHAVHLLEDRGPNANWRPGPRALAALLD